MTGVYNSGNQGCPVLINKAITTYYKSYTQNHYLEATARGVMRKWQADEGCVNFIKQTRSESISAFMRDNLCSSMNPFAIISTVNLTRQKLLHL